SRRLAKRLLPRQKCPSLRRMDGHLRGRRGYRFAADPLGCIVAVEADAALAEVDFECAGGVRERRFVVQRNTAAQRLQRDQPVERSTVEIAKPELACDAGGNRSLARCRGAVDCDYQRLRALHSTISRSASK